MTEAVVEWLSGDYDVEPGHGANRSEYLYKHNVTTYLIKDNQPRMKVRSHGHQQIPVIYTSRFTAVSVGPFESNAVIPMA